MISTPRLNPHGSYLYPATAWAIALLFAVRCSFCNAAPVIGSQVEHTAAAVSSIPQATVDPAVIHLPIVEASDLRFRRLSTSDGLSQTRVAQIIQDDQGFMWFGTQYGINRYDGYDFKLFVHDPTRPNGSCAAFVQALFKDRSGALWIGCSQMVDRFDPRTETFTHYRIDPARPNDANGTVVHISQDRDGILWLATTAGLHRLDPATGIITHFRHSTAVPKGLSTDDINWSGEDRAGSFWVGTHDGLDEFDRTTGTVRLHIPVSDPVRVSFFEDRFGVFWITQATGSGLATYDKSSHTLTKYSFYAQAPDAASLTGVMGAVEDDDGALWIGSPGIGLLRFDRAHRRFVRYRSRPHDMQSIAEDKVIALTKDSAGGVWIGLHSKGPNYFSRRTLPFRTFKSNPDDPHSLSTDFVNAIFEDRQGTIWLGNDDGLNQIDQIRGIRKVVTAGLGNKPMVITIAQDLAGLIWFGTFGHGLVSYDPRSGHYSVYRHDPAVPLSLSSDKVHRVFIDHRGTLWIATESGLDYFDPARRRFHAITASKHDPEQSYTSIAEDKTGILWIGTAYSGLERFDSATGQLREYKSDPMDLNGLRDNLVRDVYVGASGSVWIGTQNGLNKLDPATDKLSAYDIHNGIPANDVGCLLEDDQQNLWMSTTHGLSRFNPRDGSFANYSEADGLPGDDLTGWSTCFKSSRGELFFGGFAGGAGFFPAALNDKPNMPRVVLTSLEISGATVLIGPNEPLHEAITYADRITLSHEQNSFSIQFAAVDYASPQTTRYRYRLVGVDPHWYEVGAGNRRASYTTLAAGQYELRVQAARPRGPWSEPGASLQIHVLPPWWATWWFRTVYATLGVLALGAAYAIRVRQISRQVTIRMEERIDERTRIARDLHDTLLQGVLSASLQLSIARSQLATDFKATPILDRVVQLLRQMIEESRNTLRGLRVRPLEGQGLERAISQIPRDLGVNRGLEINVVVEGEPRALQLAVRDEVYWIAREAIANALRHSNAATIEAALEYSRSRFRLVIRDNGHGIDTQLLEMGRDNHWGLLGMAERAKRIGGTLNLTSAVGAGTEIELTIPAIVAFEARPAERA